ncbi:unnamed protein product [Spirodela intermedia]|uniref:Uncharacterized protein n=1 Tax=Spirodela intermedia TaxID=51605 RepID=A0A7I8JF97_SPIIN|nr:unnamed protein product [Spirodela intermedia]CAA6668830.1 unnamed protein product [Spirodela intermedia]
MQRGGGGQDPRSPALRRPHGPTLSAVQAAVTPPRRFAGGDLARIVSCRPRFLAGRIGNGLDARLAFLRTLFQSDGELLRAVVRNPSLLNYDVDRTMRPCVELYERVGVGRRELGRAATYKYAVSVLAVSHLETIREKMANLEKFGFSADEVLALFGRTPNLLTLSVEKVQRNMTYIVQPFLVFANLESVLKPRFQLGGKLGEMELQPQARFLKRFIDCHDKKLAEELRGFYLGVKGVKRLAAASKSTAHKGFPF